MSRSSAAMVEIDCEILPKKCLVDTGVLIRALRQRSDKDSAVCEAFFKAMIGARGHEMLVAAPTVTEMLRGNGEPIPTTRSLVVVAFDKKAAEICGREFPVKVLKSMSRATGLTHSYLKFDAMIAACALRWSAECVVALDHDHTILAKNVKLEVKSPNDFVVQQLGLSLVPEADEV